MWKKSFAIFLSLLFLCCSPPLVFSQSATPATWESFDLLIANLKIEIDNLSGQLQRAEASLTASTAELQTLREKLAEREALYQKLNTSYQQSKLSLLTSASDLAASRAWNVTLAIAEAVTAVLMVYFTIH